ncbi:MAG: SpoVA/SpoVAEb family sporulation membrane protein [Raoultibacter sp.]
MEFLGAFIVGGLLCVLCQIPLEFKVPVPVILICGLVLGALMTPLGWAPKLVELGGAGMIATVIDAGEGVFMSFTALLDGNPVSFLIFLCVPVAVSLCGVAGGLVRASMKKGQQSSVVEVETTKMSEI